jgi:hypothetical protein
VLRPSFPEGCSIVDKDLVPGFDLLCCLKHHVELSRTVINIWGQCFFSPLRNRPIDRPHNPSLWTASL